jgi:transcriptional regulator with XRE-family HTH domain
MRRKRKFDSLREYLDRTNTIQAELSEMAGITQAHLSQILSGRRRPSIQLLFKLAKLTGVPVEAIEALSREKSVTDSEELGRPA